MRDAMRFAGYVLLVIALLVVVVFTITGLVLAEHALFPSKTVCVLSHDEEHSGATYSLCDKRVPR